MWRRSFSVISRLFLLFIAMVLVVACDSDDAPEEIPTVLEGTFPGVDERLWPYFTRFQREASDRDIIVDLVAEGITGTIELIEEENVAGVCNFNSRDANHVMIDLAFWNRAPDLFREFIVFHELGHCALLRDHREDPDLAGRCVSIMRSGLGDCTDNYTFATRVGYLDELYDPAFAADIIDNR